MTKTQQKQAKSQLARLINEIGPERICLLAGCTMSTLRSWLSRGRISSKAAHLVCLSPDVANAGFTREKLRPDVSVWWVE